MTIRENLKKKHSEINVEQGKNAMNPRELRPRDIHILKLLMKSMLNLQPLTAPSRTIPFSGAIRSSSNVVH